MSAILAPTVMEKKKKKTEEFVLFENVHGTSISHGWARSPMSQLTIYHQASGVCVNPRGKTGHQLWSQKVKKSVLALTFT